MYVEKMNTGRYGLFAVTGSLITDYARKSDATRGMARRANR